MKTTIRIATTFVLLAMAGAWMLSGAAAQAPPPADSPEIQKLQRFIGTWNGTGDMKASEAGPAGTMTWTETCEWFDGRHHVICHSKGKGPAGEVHGMSVMGYDPAGKIYTLYGVDSDGWSDFSMGTVSGKTWSFTNRTNTSRFSLIEVSDTKHTFTWELSTDGKTWTGMMTGEASKGGA